MIYSTNKPARFVVTTLSVVAALCATGCMPLVISPTGLGGGGEPNSLELSGKYYAASPDYEDGIPGLDVGGELVAVSRVSDGRFELRDAKPGPDDDPDELLPLHVVEHFGTLMYDVRMPADESGEDSYYLVGALRRGEYWWAIETPHPATAARAAEARGMQVSSPHSLRNEFERLREERDTLAEELRRLREGLPPPSRSSQSPVLAAPKQGAPTVIDGLPVVKRDVVFAATRHASMPLAIMIDKGVIERAFGPLTEDSEQPDAEAVFALPELDDLAAYMNESVHRAKPMLDDLEAATDAVRPEGSAAQTRRYRHEVDRLSELIMDQFDSIEDAIEKSLEEAFEQATPPPPPPPTEKDD